ncbi:MAG: hypothetical protein JSR59_19695 [Proteobacteria bacterium]|nr:hypothetical protein [Pseudomonadota bacterium]
MLLLAAAGSAVRADPGYYVVTTYSDEGLRFVDTRYWTVKQTGEPATRWPEFGFGYGVTSRWTTELYASWIGSTEHATHLAAVNWQNDVLLTQGQYPFDLALHLTLIHDQSSSRGEGVEYGPVFQTDFGRMQINANLFFEREFDAGNATPQFKYQWQIRHRWTRAFQFGLQGFGELGDWDHWSPHEQQSHRAGPAFFGGWPLGDGRELRYQAAFLFGSVYGSNAGMFTTRVYCAF